MKGPVHRRKIFVNFGPLTARSRTRVFTHPPKILREPAVTTMKFSTL